MIKQTSERAGGSRWGPERSRFLIDRGLPPVFPPRVNKASVEIEAALALVAAIAIAVVFEAPQWTAYHQKALHSFAFGVYLGALLSPDRTFCDRLESWLQALLGILYALTWFVAADRTGVWLVLVVPAGLLVAILGNQLQRRLLSWS
jgi:hypothetical protein